VEHLLFDLRKGNNNNREVIEMKTTLLMMSLILTTVFTASLPSKASDDFWSAYSDNIRYNHYTQNPHGVQMTDKQNIGVFSKSFSQSFAMRLSEITKDRKFIAIICSFSKQPDKCVLDPIKQQMFKEIAFISNPDLSQKTIKKISRIYSKNLYSSKNTGKTGSGSFKLGLNIETLKPTLSTGFKFRNGISLKSILEMNGNSRMSITKNRLSFEIFPNDSIVKYQIPNPSFSKRNIYIYYSIKNHSAVLGNSMIDW